MRDGGTTGSGSSDSSSSSASSAVDSVTTGEARGVDFLKENFDFVCGRTALSESSRDLICYTITQNQQCNNRIIV